MPKKDEHEAEDKVTSLKDSWKAVPSARRGCGRWWDPLTSRTLPLVLSRNGAGQGVVCVCVRVSILLHISRGSPKGWWSAMLIHDKPFTYRADPIHKETEQT